MNNDLISLDYIVEVYNRVKVVCKNCDNCNGVRCRACDIGDELLDLQDIIDNAPTVDIKDQIAGAYNEGYMCGNKEAEKARLQGEWITDYENLKCPFCGMSIDDEVHWLYSEEYDFNFCPNCGAKMKGGAE